MPSLRPRPYPRISLSLGPALLLVACPGDPAATTAETSTGAATTTGTTTDTGGEPTSTSASTTATPTTGDPTSSTTEPATSTSTGPLPNVCGDGIVGDLEVCDDGNEDPDDGCNDQCQKTGAVEWTYTYNGPGSKNDGVEAIAVDATGRIIVAGFETSAMNEGDMLLIALAPDGSELWRKSIAGAAGEDDALLAVTVDDDGNIYAAGYEEYLANASNTVVRAFGPDGGELWTYVDPPPVDDYSIARGITLHDGALYTVGEENLLDAGTHLVVRRHDLATGEAAWKTISEEGSEAPFGGALAVVGSDVVVAGYALDNSTIRPLLAVFTDAGDHVETIVEDHPGGAWFDVDPIGDAGDLVLVGRRHPEGVTGIDLVVRRVGPDFSEQWTQLLDHDLLFDTASDVAIGPDEAIFVSGGFVRKDEFQNVFGGRYSPQGTLLWTHTYNNPDIELDDFGTAAGFGPGFVVIGGYETVLGQGANVWVRRLKAD